VAVGYVTFLAMDLAGAVVAFILDRRPPAMAWVILVQRFYYRQFLYIVTLCAVMAILRGGRRGWNKLIRTGSVGLPYGRRVGDSQPAEQAA
jgi:peptidoglycan-N-acetylglucosamine deacetylase